MKNLFLNLLLSANANPLEGTVADVPEGLFDRFIYGLQFSGIGIVVVFIVLIILMIVLKVFERIFAKSSTAATSEAVIGSAPVASAPAPAAADDDMVIAAAIAAAVDAYYDNVQAQANVPVHARKKYQIRSFRKI